MVQIAADPQRGPLIGGFESRFQVDANDLSYPCQLLRIFQVTPTSGIQQPASGGKMLPDEITVECVFKLTVGVVFFEKSLALFAIFLAEHILLQARSAALANC